MNPFDTDLYNYSPEAMTSRFQNVSAVFEHHCSHVVFDHKLLRKVMHYEQHFVNKNEVHISFFGGNLMGVDPVRFKDEDRNRWFQEVLNIDDDAIEEDLHNLPDILSHRHVSSDVMNLTCLWVAHKFMTTKLVSEEEGYMGAFSTMLILQYKFITSILADWFTYTADPIVAQATYTQLTKRFGLKTYGSWGALLRSRAEQILAKVSIHYKEIMTFQNDLKIVYMVNDIQGRIKDILKNIRDVFTIVSNSPELQINNISSSIELDGVVRIRDKTRMIGQYMTFILEVIQDKNGFIIPPLVDVITATVPAVSAARSMLTDTLTYMSANSSPKRDPRVNRICEITLQHAFDYLQRNPGTMTSNSDIPGLIRKMRALYQSSRTTDVLILEMRNLTEAVIGKATGSKNKTLIAAMRNAVLLYILLRTFTMSQFRK